MIPSQTDTIVERLRQIERENRQLRWVGSALFLGLVVLITAGTGLVGRTNLAVERLEWKDKRGVVRARLALAEDGSPRLAFLDAQGGDQMVIQARDNASSIELFTNRQLRASLVSSSDGSSTLQFFDKSRNAPSCFYMWAEGTTGLLLSGRETPLHLTAKANGQAKLSVLDQNFQERATLWFSTEGKFDWETIPIRDQESLPPILSRSTTVDERLYPTALAMDRIAPRH
jgi:hypothetical protein